MYHTRPRFGSGRGFAAMVVAIAVLLVSGQTLSAQGSDLGVTFSPGASLPLGDDREFFSVVPGMDIQFVVSPGTLPILYGSAGIRYSLALLAIDNTLSLIDAGAGTGLRLPMAETARMFASGGGGYSYGFLNDGAASSSAGYVTGAIGLEFDLSRTFSIGLTGEYRNYLGLGQFMSVGLNGAVRFGRSAAQPVIQQQPIIQQPHTTAPRPLNEAEDAAILQISDLDLAEVFPVFFKYYDANAVGSARITNATEEPITDIKMNLYVAEYMDNPTAVEAPRELGAGESAEIDLFTFFNERVLAIEQSTLKSAQLSVTFAQQDQEYARTYTQNVRLHDRNSMTWDDLSRPAAYVTPQDSSVLAVSRHVSAVARSAHQGAVHPSLRTVIALHTTMDLYGMSYTPDPSSPYRRLEEELAIDYLQFPRQTLSFRAGDCDDLAILYCALLESLSIPSAMVLVPGHIFIAFNLEMTPVQARSEFARAEDLIFYEDEAWIPLEITSISDGFLEAWQIGAREWRESVAREQETLIVTADAWETYEPVGLPAAEPNLDLPTQDAIRVAYSEQVTDFVDQTIYPLVARIQAQIAERGRLPRLVNRLAVLYAKYGLFERARCEWESLIEEAPTYAPAIGNLGNVEFQEGNLTQAEQLFQKALQLEPDDPRLLLGLARASHALENYGTADSTFDRVKELAPELATRFAYLDLRGDDAARAAEIGGLSDEAFWIEEEEE